MQIYGNFAGFPLLFKIVYWVEVLGTTVDGINPAPLIRMFLVHPSFWKIKVDFNDLSLNWSTLDFSALNIYHPHSHLITG